MLIIFIYYFSNLFIIKLIINKYNKYNKYNIMILIFYTTNFLPFYIYAKAISIFLTQHNIENKMVDIYKTFQLEQVKKNDIIICWLPYFHKRLYGIIKDRINEFKIIIINSEPLYHTSDYYKCINNINCKKILFLDYTYNNINLISKINKFNHIVSPFTYHPYFEEHFKENSDNNINKDIDFLLVGWNKSNRRKYIQKQLENKYNYVTLCSTPYKNLYNTIKRSKIIVLIRYFEYDDCIDFYRLSYLLSNKAFVIHEMTTDPLIKDFNKIIYSSYDNFINTCEEWINKSQDERDAKVNDIYDWWKINHHIDKYIPLSEINKFINS